MNDEAAFLRHINENPNDFTARLVFADWLEEQDDPVLRERGEFIRTQFQLEELPEWDPRRYPLLATANRLLGRHRRRWLPSEADGFAHETYRRGFIEELRLPVRLLLDEGEKRFDEAPVRSVRLWMRGGNGLDLWTAEAPHVKELLKRLRSSPRWTEIEGVDFGPSGEWWEPNERTKPDSLRSVRSLRLTGPRQDFKRLFREFTGLENLVALLDDRALQAFTDSYGRAQSILRSLDLSRSSFTQELGWRNLLSSPALSNVESLEVDSTYHRFSLEGSRLLAGCQNLSKLRRLSLRNNWLDEPSCVAIIDSEKLSSLTELDLGDNDIYDKNMTTLAGCPGLERLRTLGLHHNGIRDAGAKSLAKSPYFTNLESLDLFDNRITDVGMKAICRDGAFPVLRSLNLLQNNSLTSSGLLTLVNSELGAQLEELSIDSQEIASTTWKRWFHRREVKLIRLQLGCQFFSLGDAENLGKVAFPPSLLELDLRNCSMPSQAIQYLAGLPQLNQLGSLILTGNSLDDAAVLTLANSPHLSQLHTLEIVANHLGPLADETYRALIDSPHLSRIARLRIAPPRWDGSEALAEELRGRFGITFPIE